MRHARLACACLSLSLVAACETGEDFINPVRSREYSAHSIFGVVIDEDTQQPVAGVVVIAVWELVGGLEGGSVLGAVQVLEAITDGDGRYRLPSWGPILHTGRGSLDSEAPKLIFLKQDYKFSAYKNWGVPADTRRSNWSGKTVALKKLRDDPAALRESFSTLQLSLRFAEEDLAQCTWRKMPHAIAESMRQASDLSGRRILYLGELGAYLVANDQVIRARYPNCGSPKEFVDSLPR